MKKYIALLLILSTVEIGLALYLTYFRETFWNAISNKEQLHFIQQLGVFTVVALGASFVSGVSGYFVALSTIEWRKVLNDRAHKVDVQAENLNQRIQEDCSSYPDLILNIGYGAVKALMYIIVFVTSLLMSFHWWYLLILVGYAVIGSIATNYIAKPLIKLNYEQQRAEATYRNNLTIDNFSDCIRIMFGLAKKQKHLTYFQQLYLQAGVVIPLIIIAPTYFYTAMTIGVLMRFNSLASTILDNMSYGISSFGIINKLLSCRKRLKEVGVL